MSSPSHEPVSLGRITKAIDATIEDLKKIDVRNDDDRRERERVVDLLEHLAGFLTVAIPCRPSFVPTWLRPK